MEKKIKEIKETFMTILKKPEMQILPGQIAFYFLMSIIPIVAISAFVAAYVTKSFNLFDAINEVMPSVFAKILASLATNMHIKAVAFILFLYVLLGSNAPASIITASNMLYGVKQPTYLKLKTKSFIMTLIIVLLLLFVVIIPLFGDIIVKALVTLFKIKNAYRYAFIYHILKVIISILIMYTIIKIIYTTAPDKKIKSSTTTKGALFTTFSWIVATYAFAFYITNIASYTEVYGSFASILILLLWLYFLGYLFVVGMAINVESFQKQGKWLDEKSKKERKQKRSNKKEEE